MSKPICRARITVVAPRSGWRDRAIGGGTTGDKEVVADFGKDHVV